MSHLELRENRTGENDKPSEPKHNQCFGSSSGPAGRSLRAFLGPAGRSLRAFLGPFQSILSNPEAVLGRLGARPGRLEGILGYHGEPGGLPGLVWTDALESAREASNPESLGKRGRCMPPDASSGEGALSKLHPIQTALGILQQTIAIVCFLCYRLLSSAAIPGGP